ncbi:MAG: T9SS type A sorting domain-containing protein [Candidatus Kapaibacterium sp.]|jgi:hypothetical protein
MKVVYSILVLWLICSADVYAQWRQVGPWRSAVFTAVSHDGIQFVGSHTGTVYRTSDGGRSFRIMSAGLPVIRGTSTLANVSKLQILGNNLWALPEYGVPLYWNISQGKWDSDIPAGSPSDITIVSMFLFRNGVYGISSSDLWKKDSAGWSLVPLAVDSTATNLRYIDVYSSDSVVSIVTNRGVVRSRDSLKTWRFEPLNFSNVSLTACTGSGKTLLAIRQGGGLARSLDFGATWDTTVVGLPSGIASSISADSGVFYVFYKGIGLFSSYDALRWNTIPAGTVAENIATAAVAGGVVFGGTLIDGIYVTDTSFTEWKLTTSGLRGMRCSEATIKDDFLFGHSQGHVWEYNVRTNEHSLLPLRQTTNNYVEQIGDGHLSGDSLYVVETSSFLKRNPDTVVHFVNIYNRKTAVWVAKECFSDPSPSSSIADLNAVAMEGRKLYTGFSSGLIRYSANFGRDWFTIRPASFFSVLSVHKNVLVTLGVQLGNQISVDFGESWQRIDLEVAKSKSYYLDGVLFLLREQGFVFSPDTGKTWSEQETLDGSVPMAIAGKLNDMYVLYDSSKIVRYIGTPGDWKRGAFSSPGVKVLNLFSNATTLIAETNEGYFVRDIEPATNVRDDEYPSAEAVLWPQPANTRLNVKINSPVYKLGLYDINGSRICDIDPHQISERAEAALDVSELPAGVYVLKIDSTEYRKSVCVIVSH